MFTGIIETVGAIVGITEEGTNRSFWISSAISSSLKIDQSVSHDGVCLTVEAVADDRHKVTAVLETLEKTTLAGWTTGWAVNLERSMILNGRIDGHLVQGHVDATAVCTSRKELDGSWELRFSFPEQFAALIIEKGSICLNGISLTVFDVTLQEFSVAVIPYTFAHTNISGIVPAMTVNIEFDMIGKYAQRMISVSFTSNRDSLHER